MDHAHDLLTRGFENKQTQWLPRLQPYIIRSIDISGETRVVHIKHGVHLKEGRADGWKVAPNGYLDACPDAVDNFWCNLTDEAEVEDEDALCFLTAECERLGLDYLGLAIAQSLLWVQLPAHESRDNFFEHLANPFDLGGTVWHHDVGS